MNWEAKGGKSNSQFRKTLDNRFVLKEMSKQEVEWFLEIAPHYIEYLIDCIKNNKPTTLAKIIGAYRICLVKNTTISKKAVKMDVIVLENLFYSKSVTQVFDLKGSERNRLVNVSQETAKQAENDIVLLDENFLISINEHIFFLNNIKKLKENFFILKGSFQNPIYIRPHSKQVLMKAIENDTKFLSSKFIMDYSLLCGFNDETNEIVVGIIGKYNLRILFSC
jgi:1-phosphatidylinositol-3-phosphate 5-kinase